MYGFFVAALPHKNTQFCGFVANDRRRKMYLDTTPFAFLEFSNPKKLLNDCLFLWRIFGEIS
jgi:hypothetical protein